MREPRKVHIFGINRFTDPDEREAAARQEYVDSLQGILNSADHVENFPTILMEAIERELWWKPRRLGAGTIVPGMSVDEFLATPYPRGLGTTRAVVEKLIAGNEAAMLAWANAITADHGGAHNPEGIGGKSGKQPAIVKINNIKLDNKSRTQAAPGTSSKQGLRRLDKAASKGDAKAADLLSRVLSVDDPMTVHAACVGMGWRKHTLTVVDTPEDLGKAHIRKTGPLGVVQFAWEAASARERAEIAAWIKGQLSGVRRLL